MENNSTKSTFPVTASLGSTSPPNAASPDSSADSQRKLARRRALWCSGAGLSHLGYSRAGAVVLGISLLLIAALWWFCLAPSPWAVRAVGLALLAAVVTLGVEFVAIGRLSGGGNPPGLLSRKHRLVCLVVYPIVLALLVTMALSFSVVRIRSDGMEPTIAENECLLYHQELDESRLERDQVIVWKPTERSATADSGALMVGRILAIPGDTISLRGKFYIVNGQVTSRMGTPGRYAAVLAIPHLPESIKVPENRYFMVQDHPLVALDSRVLSWATREGMVSNNLYRLSLRGFMGPLE